MVNGDTILFRADSVIDLVADEAKYHRKYYFNFFKLSSERQPDNALDEAYEKLFPCLRENEECQYFWEDIKEKMSKNTLRKMFSFPAEVETPVVCFKDTWFKILNNSWYEQRLQNPEAECLRILKNPEKCICNLWNNIQWLRIFTKDVINKLKKHNSGDKTRKCTVINQVIIVVTRPRYFLSMI